MYSDPVFAIGRSVVCIHHPFIVKVAGAPLKQGIGFLKASVIWVILYLFTEVLDIPTAFGGLGHGGRAHSPNEYVTLDSLRMYERSVAAFLMKLAEA